MNQTEIEIFVLNHVCLQYLAIASIDFDHVVRVRGIIKG